jgi:hypothetical protein
MLRKSLVGLTRGLEGVASKPFFTALPCIVHMFFACNGLLWEGQLKLNEKIHV